MKSQLYIPKKVKVGFQNRKDTFTQKLAYVTYYDDKGVLRKEKSWDGWRDKKIDPVDLDNVPHSGFTLNKDVYRDGGRFGSGHNHIRVYDDRGAEFEISPENLIFILMNTNCVKRCLEGEFVYSWNGTELVLLPTSCVEYKESQEFTSLRTKKISSRDLVPGLWYKMKTKDNTDLLYLGRYDFYEWDVSNLDNRRSYLSKRVCKKKFVFFNGKEYVTQTGASNVACSLSDVPDPDFASKLEDFFNSFHSGKVVGFELVEKEFPTFPQSLKNYWRVKSVNDWIYKDGEYLGIEYAPQYDSEYRHGERWDGFYYYKGAKKSPSRKIYIESEILHFPGYVSSYDNSLDFGGRDDSNLQQDLPSTYHALKVLTENNHSFLL